jgi:hypothetical protein
MRRIVEALSWTIMRLSASRQLGDLGAGMSHSFFRSDLPNISDTLAALARPVLTRRAFR